jgi:hypothetical protein
MRLGMSFSYCCFFVLFPPLLLGGGVRIKLSYFSVLFGSFFWDGMGFWVFLDLVGLVQHIFDSFLVFVDQVLSLYSTMSLRLLEICL